jgi:hypothetical protein
MAILEWDTHLAVLVLGHSGPERRSSLPRKQAHSSSSTDGAHSEYEPNINKREVKLLDTQKSYLRQSRYWDWKWLISNLGKSKRLVMYSRSSCIGQCSYMKCQSYLNKEAGAVSFTKGAVQSVFYIYLNLPDSILQYSWEMTSIIIIVVIHVV